MRTFFLLLLVTMPSLVACSASYAKTSTEIGKPVCTHYDDATKAEAQHTTSTVVGPASSTAPAGPAVAATASATAGAGNATPQTKSGGTASMMRPHDAPHWQTFLPGMFK